MRSLCRDDCSFFTLELTVFPKEHTDLVLTWSVKLVGSAGEAPRMTTPSNVGHAIFPLHALDPFTGNPGQLSRT